MARRHTLIKFVYLTIPMYIVQTGKTTLLCSPVCERIDRKSQVLPLKNFDCQRHAHFTFLETSQSLRARLVYVFKNWKLLFENICENTCGWKSMLKCINCCLKTENNCLKTQTKHSLYIHVFRKHLWKYMWVKKCIEMRKILFKNWK